MDSQDTNDIEMERRFKQYLFFFTGQIFSLLGSVVVSSSIIWYIVQNSEDPDFFLAIALGITYLPRILTILFAGVIADIANRKKIIILADLFQTITTIAVIFLFIFEIGDIWLLIALNSLRGLFQVFHRMAANAIIPKMVPQNKLSRINGINSFINGIAWIAGPFIGAVLMLNFDIEQVLWVDAITFVIAVIPLLFISLPSVKITAEKKGKLSLFTEFKQGLRTMRNTPGLLTLSIWAGVVNLISLPVGLLLPAFIKDNPHGGTQFHYAMVNGYYFAGLLLGSLLMSIKKRWKYKQTYILITCTLTFVSIIITALAKDGDFVMMGIGRFIYGFNISIATALYYTIIQLIVVPDQQGKILSIDEIISFGVYPFIMFLTGFLTLSVNLVILFVVLAIIGIVFNVGMLFSKFRKIDFDNISTISPDTDPV